MLEAAAPVIDAHAADMKSGIARIAGGRSEVRRERIRAGEPTHPSPSPPGQRILLARPTFVTSTNNTMRSRAFSLAGTLRVKVNFEMHFLFCDDKLFAQKDGGGGGARWRAAAGRPPARHQPRPARFPDMSSQSTM